MRFYPLFFPKHPGIMVKESDCKDIKCPECDQPFLECCRTPTSLWSSVRFCKCSYTLCKIGTRTINYTSDSDYTQGIEWHRGYNRFKFIPFNWRAAILGASYTLPEKDLSYLKNKQSKLTAKLNKMLEKNPEPKDKEQVKAKQIYSKIKRLDSIIRVY